MEYLLVLNVDDGVYDDGGICDVCDDAYVCDVYLCVSCPYGPYFYDPCLYDDLHQQMPHCLLWVLLPVMQE
jgi:hypothetical protein